MKGIYFNNLKNPALDPIVDTMELNMLLDDPSESEKAEIRDNFVNEVMMKMNLNCSSLITSMSSLSTPMRFLKWLSFGKNGLWFLS